MFFFTGEFPPPHICKFCFILSWGLKRIKKKKVFGRFGIVTVTACRQTGFFASHLFLYLPCTVQIWYQGKEGGLALDTCDGAGPTRHGKREACLVESFTWKQLPRVLGHDDEFSQQCLAYVAAADWRVWLCQRDGTWNPICSTKISRRSLMRSHWVPQVIPMRGKISWPTSDPILVDDHTSFNITCINKHKQMWWYINHYVWESFTRIKSSKQTAAKTMELHPRAYLLRIWVTLYKSIF